MIFRREGLRCQAWEIVVQSAPGGAVLKRVESQLV